MAPAADPQPVAVAPALDAAVLAAIKANTKRNAPARLADVFKTLQQSGFEPVIDPDGCAKVAPSKI